MLKGYSRGAPPPAPPGDFPFGESHQSHFAPKGVARYAGSSHLGWPQEVRIRRVLAPDAHAPNPFGVPLGSTSALPRRSLAYGAELPPSLNHGGFSGLRMARPSEQAFARKPEGARGWTPRVGRRCRDAPSDDRKAKARSAGRYRAIREAFLWDLSCRDKKGLRPRVREPDSNNAPGGRSISS